jgi:hypothetical protein
MPSYIADLSAPALQGPLPKRPEDLPHGLIAPPSAVRELIELERTKHPPADFARAEERLLNEWTVDYYFESLGHEVLYRNTPDGPDVVAVGLAEVLAVKKSLSLDEQKDLNTFLDY